VAVWHAGHAHPFQPSTYANAAAFCTNAQAAETLHEISSLSEFTLAVLATCCVSPVCFY
jgi:hypothetical protein